MMDLFELFCKLIVDFITPYYIILYHIGPFWIIFKPFKTILGNYGPFWAISNHFYLQFFSNFVPEWTSLKS